MGNILYPAQLKYLESFRKKDDDLIEEMEAYAAEHNVPIINWHSAEFLESMIRIVAPERVLEIGTAIGYSTIKIARNLKKRSTLHTIEKSKDNIAIAENNIEKSGLSNKIKILEGDAVNIMPQLKKKYDFIFLDADKEDYKRLFDYSMILLKKGGIIFVDNLLWHGYAASKTIPSKYKNSTKYIRDFNRIFINQKSIDSMILPVGDGIGIGIKA